MMITLVSILIAALVFASQNRLIYSTPPTPTQHLAFVGGRWRRTVHHQHQHQVSSSNINRCSCLRYPTNLLTSSTPSPSYTSDSKRGRLPSKSEQVSNKKHLKKVKASENRTRNDDDDDDDTTTAKAKAITNTTRIKREDKAYTNRGSTNDIPLQQETATYTIDIDIDNDTTASTIGGLLPNKAFTLLEHIHCTLTLLRKHFPTLLELPSLSTSTAQHIYESNVTVLGPKDETLAEGIDEVLLLNRALATTATAARRAGSLFDLATRSPTSSSSNNQGQVDCKILIDPNNSQKVLVLWQTRLPSPFGNRDDQSTAASSSPSSSSSYTEFSGKSTLDLSPDTGLVTNLQINEVKVNGVALIESLGSALATVRRAARSAMATSSIFDDTGSSTKKRSSGNPLLDGILSGIQDVVDAVDALPTSEEKEEDGVLLDSQLYVVPMSYWKGSTFPVDGEGILLFNSTESMNNQQQVYAPVLIDEYTIRNGQVPLAGSELFVKYAINHKALQNFVENGLYQLAGIMSLADVTTETVRSLFATNAEIVTFGNDKKDYITLLSGAGKISDLYRTLALLRDASGGEFDIQSIEADLKMCQLIVHWKTETPLQIEGTDSFVFDTPQSGSSSYRLPLSSDGDKDEVAERCSSFFDDQHYSALKICRIENLQLKVQGVNADSAWAQSFVAAVLRSGITENTPLPDTTITELLRALTTKKKDVPTKKSMESAMPTLDSTAALSFYDIIRSLHADLPNIGESSSPIPAGDYLAETMELRGLLGEVLVRGAPRYRQLLGVVLSSLHAATQTNAVRLATKPKPTIEITPKGSIKMNLVLALWVSPQLPLGGGQQNNNQGFGVPLKIDISSEYIIDERGKIREQIILESRLNGVLTPGDTFAKWVKGLTRNDDDSSNAPSAIDSFMGAVNLVRSMQGRK